MPLEIADLGKRHTGSRSWRPPSLRGLRVVSYGLVLPELALRVCGRGFGVRRIAGTVGARQGRRLAMQRRAADGVPEASESCGAGADGRGDLEATWAGQGANHYRKRLKPRLTAEPNGSSGRRWNGAARMAGDRQPIPRRPRAPTTPPTRAGLDGLVSEIYPSGSQSRPHRHDGAFASSARPPLSNRGGQATSSVGGPARRRRRRSECRTARTSSIGSRSRLTM